MTAPVGVPEAFLAPAANALDGLLARCARTHGPFLTPEPAAPLGSPDRQSSTTRWSGCTPRARSCAASSGPAAPSASGAIPMCCACSAADRWRGCAARSSRSTRRRSAASCRRGTASRRSPGPVPTRPLPWLGRAGAPRRGGRPAGRRADPGLGAGTRRAAGTDPGLPAAAARRARRDGRGRLDRARQPGPRRRPHRAVPPGPRGAAARRPDRRQRRPDTPTHRRAPRPGPRAPAQPWRQLLPCHPRGRRRRLGPRDARCAVGPGLGRRGHQRHVRAAAGAALEAAVRLRSWRAARTAEPPDRARPARGRGSLVAGRTGRGGRPDGTAARPGARTAGAAWGADPRGGRGRGARGRVRRRLPGPPSPRGGGSDPARLLRRRARGSPVRAGRGARPAARGARAARRARPPRACTSSPPRIRRTRTGRRCHGRGATTTTDARSSGQPAPMS